MDEKSNIKEAKRLPIMFVIDILDGSNIRDYLTPKNPGVFLVKTASNQPLLKRRRSVQNWIIF
jgi:hypothetical protein